MLSPSRDEEKTIRVPSGDQTGRWSVAGLVVNGDIVPLANSNSQISARERTVSTTVNAALVSSGETEK